MKTQVLFISMNITCDKNMINYCRDARSQYDKDLEIEIELMVQKISYLLSKTQLKTILQANQRVFRIYRGLDWRISELVQERNQFLKQLDPACQSFDDKIEQIQRLYGFDNYRNKPSPSHQYFKQWQVLRRLVFERFEIQSALKQHSAIFDKLIALKARLSDLRKEIFCICRRVTKKSKPKRQDLSLYLIAQLEDKFAERQTIFESVTKVLEEQLNMSQTQIYELIDNITQIRADNRQMIRLLTPPNTLI